MQSRYHAELTRGALGAHFAPLALDETVRANLGQDALRYQLGTHPHFHFDNNRIAEGRAYVAALHMDILALAASVSDDNARAQRIALGQLLHAVQDFYAHSNYVDLWLASHAVPGMQHPPPDTIDPVDPAILAHPDLITGTFVFWRDIIYYIPLLGWLARRIWVPPTSHEGMNLDSPRQGWRFDYAYEAAYRRTRHEARRAITAVRAAGGPRALAAFTGT